jgi:hypothetical protein
MPRPPSTSYRACGSLRGLEGNPGQEYTFQSAWRIGQVRSLTIRLKQLVWALARAMVPEHRTWGLLHAMGSKKSHST